MLPWTLSMPARRARLTWACWPTIRPGPDVTPRWDDVIDAAEAFNDPGQFTTFIGYQWMSLIKGGNMHRNVIFCDNGDRARQVLPFTMSPLAGSTDPLDLYKYLDNYKTKTNGAVMAFAHNGNLSNGMMFPVDAQ
jgi:hypothetical protein